MDIVDIKPEPRDVRFAFSGSRYGDHSYGKTNEINKGNTSEDQSPSLGLKLEKDFVSDVRERPVNPQMASDSDSDEVLVIDEQYESTNGKNPIPTNEAEMSNSKNIKITAKRKPVVRRKKSKMVPKKRIKKPKNLAKTQYVQCYTRFVNPKSRRCGKKNVVDVIVNKSNSNFIAKRAKMIAEKNSKYCAKESNSIDKKNSIFDTKKVNIIEIVEIEPPDIQDSVFKTNQPSAELKGCELKNIKETILENNFSVKQEPFDDEGNSHDSNNVTIDEHNIKKEILDNEEFTDIDAFIEDHFEEYYEEEKCSEELSDHHGDSADESNDSNDYSPASQFACRKCDKVFKAHARLKRHEMTHSKEKMPHACKLCGRGFKMVANLNKHVLVQHTKNGVTEKCTLTCPVCHKLLKTQSALAHHSLVHSDVRPHLCKICKTSFKEVPTLKRHMWTHLKKQHQCKICEKHFVEKHSLNRHIRTLHAEEQTQTEEDKYSCQTCKKEFLSFSKFDKHNRCHGNPDFECPFCRKIYAGPSHLKVHMRIHTGEKPFKCETCKTSFTFKHVLQAHMKRMHKYIDNYPCNLCSDIFHRKNDLANHLTTHLTENPIVSEENLANNKKLDKVKQLQNSMLMLNNVLPIGDAHS